MSGRHSGLSCGCETGARAGRPLARASRIASGARVLALAATSLAAACATSGANNEHGPTFLGDAGDAATGDDGAPAEAGAGDAGDTGDAAVGDAGGEGGSASPDANLDSPAGQTGDASDTGTVPADAAGNPDAGASDAAACPSTMALLAMGGSSVAEARFSGGAWSAATLASQGAAASPALPALLPFAGGYLGTFVGSGTSAPLEGVAYEGAWSAPARVGAIAAQGTPAMAATGSTEHVLYWGGDGKFYHGVYDASWNGANDPVQVGGGAQSFGSSGPAVAAPADAGGALVVVQAGTNGTLYDQTWTAGAWQAASAHAGTALVATISPAVVALQGGAADLLVVYVRASDYHLMFTSRTAGIWSSPGEVYDVSGNIAFTGAAPALAALPGGGAVLLWLRLDVALCVLLRLHGNDLGRARRGLVVRRARRLTAGGGDRRLRRVCGRRVRQQHRTGRGCDPHGFDLVDPDPDQRRDGHDLGRHRFDALATHGTPRPVVPGAPDADPLATRAAMSTPDHRDIPPPPSSKRTMSTEHNFFRDLVDDLTVRIEWLEQVIDSVPDSGALTQLRGWSKALRELHTSIVHVQNHLDDPRFARLFAIEGALAAFLSRLFAWCEEISADFEAVAVKLRKGEPVLALFSHRAVNDSFAHFQKLGEALREELATSRPTTAEAQAAWRTFDSDFEELLWATEWLHMSLASQPGS